MAAVSTEDVNTPQRSFALDPQGRPRFIYLDNTAPDHRGTFYAYCDDQCLDLGAWSETKISLSNDPFYEHYYYPSLAFTDQGQPRVVGDGLYLLQGQPLAIYYLACDSNCDNSGNWERVPLFDRGSGVNVSWDLEMNGSAPRLAFYEGAQLGGAGDTLYYTWCNHDCLNADNWQGQNLGLGWSDGGIPTWNWTPRAALASPMPCTMQAAWGIAGVPATASPLVAHGSIEPLRHEPTCTAPGRWPTRRTVAGGCGMG